MLPTLARQKLIPLILIGGLLLSLFVALILVRQRQDIRPKASSSNITLSLYPTTETFTVGGNKTFELKATFTGGSSSEKLDYFKTEVSFSKDYLQVPSGSYIDTSQSGLSKIFRVDGPQVGNESGKLIIELGVQSPGTGPSTDKPITIAKITFSGKSQTSSSQTISVGNTQVVNNQSAALPFTTQGASFTVGGGTGTPSPTGPSSSSGKKADFLLSADKNGPSVGENFNVKATLRLTDPALKTSGVDFVLLYDKEKLDVRNIVPNVTSVDPKAPFTDAPIVTSGGVFDDTYNFVRVSLIARKPNADLVGGTIKLADIIFRGRGVGSAIIKFPEDNKYLEVVGIELGL